jgi:hypothetical protein
VPSRELHGKGAKRPLSRIHALAAFGHPWPSQDQRAMGARFLLVTSLCARKEK